MFVWLYDHLMQLNVLYNVCVKSIYTLVWCFHTKFTQMNSQQNGFPQYDLLQTHSP